MLYPYILCTSNALSRNQPLPQHFGTFSSRCLQCITSSISPCIDCMTPSRPRYTFSCHHQSDSCKAFRNWRAIVCNSLCIGSPATCGWLTGRVLWTALKQPCSWLPTTRPKRWETSLCLMFVVCFLDARVLNYESTSAFGGKLTFTPVLTFQVVARCLRYNYLGLSWLLYKH